MWELKFVEWFGDTLGKHKLFPDHQWPSSMVESNEGLNTESKALEGVDVFQYYLQGPR